MNMFPSFAIAASLLLPAISFAEEGSDPLERALVKIADRDVTIDGAKIIETDIVCSNGIIRVVDSLMVPEEE